METTSSVKSPVITATIASPSATKASGATGVVDVPSSTTKATGVLVSKGTGRSLQESGLHSGVEGNGMRIDFNVGGQVFSTTEGTLSAIPTDSVLWHLFESAVKKKEGSCQVFIDRDGASFGVILDFIRSGQLSLPSSSGDYHRRKKIIEDLRFYGVPTPFTSFLFQHTSDKRGVLHWLSNRSPEASLAKEVVVAASSCGGGALDALVKDTVGWFHTANYRLSWVSIAFKKVAVRPTHYTISHRRKSEDDAPRHWTVHGFMEASDTWHLLQKHVDDCTFDGVTASHSWTLETDQFFDAFKLTQTGKNSKGRHYFMVSGFEVYGDIMQKDGEQVQSSENEAATQSG